MGLLDKLFGSREMKDETVPVIVPNNSNGKFHFIVEDVFTITGRGTVVTGIVDSGEVRVGDMILINGSRSVEVTGIEMFRKTLDYAQTGDNCGILLKDISRDEINKGDNLTK